MRNKELDTVQGISGVKDTSLWLYCTSTLG